MPKREIGLMGYIGEAVVAYWLRNAKYPDRAYSVVYQIRPVGYSPKGGPYLDFGVIKDKKVHAVYEVKSQDYILGNVNSVLAAVWENKTNFSSYITPECLDPLKASPTLEAYLVLLAPPSDKGIRIIGRHNLKYVILFSEIFEAIEKIDRTAYLQYVHNSLDEDIDKVTKTLKNPKQGTRARPKFLRERALSEKGDNIHRK